MREHQQSSHNEPIKNSPIRSDSNDTDRNNALYVLVADPFDMATLIQKLNEAHTDKKEQSHEKGIGLIDEALQIVYLESSMLNKNNKEMTQATQIIAKPFTNKLEINKRFQGMMYFLSKKEIGNEEFLIKSLGIESSHAFINEINEINLQTGDALKMMIESIINKDKPNNYKNLKPETLPFIFLNSFEQIPDGGQRIKGLFQECLASIYQSHEAIVKDKISLKDYQKIVSYSFSHPNSIRKTIEEKLSLISEEEEPEDICNHSSLLSDSFDPEVKEKGERKIEDGIPSREANRQSDITNIGSGLEQERRFEKKAQETPEPCTCNLM